MALHLLIGSGTEPGWAVRLLAFLLTYSVHAAVCAAVTLLLVRVRCSASTRHTLWKMALFVPLLTALFSVVVPLRAEAAVRGVTELPAGFQAGAGRFVAFTSGAGSHGFQWLAGCWLVAMACGALRFTSSALALRNRLRGRTDVTNARLLQSFRRMESLIGLSSVRLTESLAVSGPLVLGSTEVCLPPAIAALEDTEVDSVFAHELAHLERADGLWFPVVGFLQSVLWLLPSNHLVCAHFRQSAELCCDDRAIELTGDPLGLASALTRVAERALFAARGLTVPTMAGSSRVLVQRVRRLASASNPAQLGTSAHRRWLLAALAGVGLATSGLSVRAAGARQSLAAPARNSALTQPAVPATAALPGAPDAAAASEQVQALLGRERRLQTELAGALAAPGAERAGTQASVRVIEVTQELSHVRATEAWTEQQFIEASVSWEKRRDLARRAQR